MDYGHGAQFGPEDADPDICLMEAVQWLLELLGDQVGGKEVERAEALLDAWLRSGKLQAWAIKRGCAEPAEVNPRAWRNHWLDWRTGRTVKVARGGTGRPEVFWGAEGEYRDVHFDRSALLTLAAAELGPAGQVELNSVPLSAMAPHDGDPRLVPPNTDAEDREGAAVAQAALQEMARPKRTIRKRPGLDGADEQWVSHAAAVAEDTGISLHAAVRQIPAEKIAGSACVESKYARIYRKVCERVEFSAKK